MGLSAAQQARYLADGFLAIDRLVDGPTVAGLRDAYDEILARGNDGERMLGGITRQVMIPSGLHPMFRRNPALDAARDIVGPLYSIQFWVALDDVDEENGCMHFVPGFHTRPLLPHVVASGEPDAEDRLLALADPGRDLPLDRAVACPLRAGGATMHSYGTPHFTPPNRSATRTRRAYIFNLISEAGLARVIEDRKN